MTHPEARIIRLQEVMTKTGLSEATIGRRIKDGTFPKSINLGGRLRGWLKSEVDKWIADRVSDSRFTD